VSVVAGHRARDRLGAATLGRPLPDARAPVTSRRLPAATPVRNRLFPKTRSWFALDAPFELLSAQSVLRILAALGWLAWPCAWALSGAQPRHLALAAVAAGTGAVVWAAIVLRRSLTVVTMGAVVAFGTANVGLLTLLGAGNGVAVVAGISAVPLGLFVAFFWGRAASCAYAVAAGCALAAGLAPSEGAWRAAGVGALAVIPIAGSMLAVGLLVQAARRQRATDPETGLLNGSGLADRLRAWTAPAAGSDGAVALAVLRLRGIEDAREALGFRVGTELLRRVVEDVGQVAPSRSLVARIGADEVVVAVRGDRTSPDSAEVAELARRLASTVAAGCYLVDGVEVALRGHVGTVVVRAGTEVAEAVRQASLGAARAVASGQPHVTWDGGAPGMTAADLALLADLRRAADRDELWVAYQPQVDAATGRLCAVEALMRWSSPTRDEVSPGRFIPLAERTGLVDDLTRWLVPVVLDAQTRWRRLGLDLPVSVNVSAASLADGDLAARIVSELDARDLPHDCLTVEVTETVAADPAQALAVLGPLRAAGVRVSIDDFGTGFTSLAALPTLPLDELKIDQHFVRGALASPADTAIISAVASLGADLGLTVVAEGVEDGDLAGHLRALGVNLLQGFHFSRPVAEERLLAIATSAPGRVVLPVPPAPVSSPV
jgi:predicted signal transduction protein with EAL and GGDEF domain